MALIRQPIGGNHSGPSLAEGVMLMSDYEMLMIILTLQLVVIAALSFWNK